MVRAVTQLARGKLQVFVRFSLHCVGGSSPSRPIHHVFHDVYLCNMSLTEQGTPFSFKNGRK